MTLELAPKDTRWLVLHLSVLGQVYLSSYRLPFEKPGQHQTLLPT